MIVIGVVGGIASGKSVVSAQLAELGAELLSADQAGHEVLQQAEVKEALVERWGIGILAENGEINRAAVAKIVFAPPPQGSEELKFLESWSHPRIAVHLEEKIQKLAKSNTKAAVLDAALLFEAGWNRLCNVVIFVESEQKTRLERAKTRGWSEDQFAAREAAQLPLHLKKERSDVIINNSGSLDHTKEQVCQFWESLSNSQAGAEPNPSLGDLNKE